MKLALIAHDGKKADMVAFVMKRMDFFKRDHVELVGTGTNSAQPPRVRKLRVIALA